MKDFISPELGHAQNRLSGWLLRFRVVCTSVDSHDTGIVEAMPTHVQ